MGSGAACRGAALIASASALTIVPLNVVLNSFDLTIASNARPPLYAPQSEFLLLNFSNPSAELLLLT
jgi:hypothetical protein